MLRLPQFLAHYRALGVSHFLLIDNGSEDGLQDYLHDQPDVSVWETRAGYKASRFGMDWLTWLQRKHAHGHWIITVDADELLIYPDHDTRKLPEFAAWLDAHGHDKIGALMLDLYPKGPVGSQTYAAGQDPREVLTWFDAYGYWAQRQQKLDNLWLQGGVRARVFFSGAPQRAPTLNKIPMIKWKRHYVFVNSTHNALPARLNRIYPEGPSEKPTAVLLHTKFLPDAVDRARSEKARGEHFSNSALYDDYYDTLARSPDLWSPESTLYSGWSQLEDLRLMSRGGW